jgi:hypothetical protein
MSTLATLVLRLNPTSTLVLCSMLATINFAIVLDLPCKDLCAGVVPNQSRKGLCAVRCLNLPCCA